MKKEPMLKQPTKAKLKTKVDVGFGSSLTRYFNAFCLSLIVAKTARQKLQATGRAWRCLGLLRFVTPELKPNIVDVVDCDYKC